MTRKPKLNSYRVRLWATLPASAEMTVNASSESEAVEYALEHSDEADWSGADYSRPSPSDVDGAELVEQRGA